MPTTTMGATEPLTVPAPAATFATCDDTCGHDAVERKVPLLPPGLREEEITAGDFALLFQIAGNKDAPAGRLRRPTSTIQAVG